LTVHKLLYSIPTFGHRPYPFIFHSLIIPIQLSPDQRKLRYIVLFAAAVVALSCRGHPDARARAETNDTDIPPPSPPLRLPPSDLGLLNPPIIFFYSLHSTVRWSYKSEWTLRLSAKGRVSTAPPNKALTRSYKYPTHLLASKAHTRSAHRSEVQPFSFPGSGRKQ
jgi:hypothetical protein